MERVLNEAKKQFDRAEIFRLTGNSTQVDFENNHLKKIDTSEDFGLALRGVKAGKIAFSTTTKPDDIEGVVKTALDVIDFSPECRFDFSGEPGKMPTEPPLYSERTASVTVKEMVDTGKAMVEKIRKYDDQIQSFVGFGTESSEVSLANTEGLNFTCKTTGAGFAVGGRLIEGQNMVLVFESRSAIEYDFDFDGITKKVIEDFEIARKNVDFKDGVLPVILTPHAVSDLLLPIMACSNGRAVAKGISPWRGRAGEQMLDKRVTIHDDGLLPNGISTAYIDDEGVPSGKTALIEKGVLKNFVHDLDSAAALGATPTGNGRRTKRYGSSRDASSPPSPSITNIVMEGGEKSFDEMMREMGDGLLIDRLMGTMMGNLYGGAVGGNVLLGYKVEGGKRVGRIKNAMFSVNTFEVLKDGLAALSKEREMLGSFLLPYVWLKSASVSAKQ